jgi:hypothetical protein
LIPWAADSQLRYFDCGRRDIIGQKWKDSLSESDNNIYLHETFCKQKAIPRFSFCGSCYNFFNEEAESNYLVNIEADVCLKDFHINEEGSFVFGDFLDTLFLLNAHTKYLFLIKSK